MPPNKNCKWDFNWSSKVTYTNTLKKQIRSNDNDFLEQSKKYSAYLAAGNQKSMEITRAFEKNNKQPISTV